MWEFVALLVVLLLWGVKFSKKDWVEQPWGLTMAKAMQGLSAIGIILHHSTQKLANTDGAVGALQRFDNLGVLFVGIFLFFSGYGLVKSHKTKPNYFKHYFRNRYAALLIPFFMCNLVYYIVDLAQGRTYSIKETILGLIGYHPLNDQCWFVIEIAIFYLAFFLFYRWIKNEVISLVGMLVFIVAFMGYSLSRGHGFPPSWFQGEWWYNTSFLFGIGLIFGTFEEALLKVMKKAYFVLLPVFVVGTYLFYRLNIYYLENISYWTDYPGHPGYGDKLKCLSAQLPMIICFVITILLLMMKLKFGNPALAFLGKLSLEIYLMQNLFLTHFREPGKLLIKNSDLFVAAVIAATVLAAFLMHLINGWIVSKVRTKKSA